MKWSIQDKEKAIKESNKRFRYEEGKREWIRDSLHGANSELKARNQELDKAKRSIYELPKMVDGSTQMQRESRLDFGEQMLDLKKDLKE